MFPLQQYKSKLRYPLRVSYHIISYHTTSPNKPSTSSNMNPRIKSVSFLILVLLASLCTSLFCVSESRPLPIYSRSKDGVIGEVNGVFRTLKNSGPSPGIGHKLDKVQNLGGMKDSGPSPGQGH